MTIRTTQLARPELPFHHTHIRAYRDHGASAHQPARPSRHLPKEHGRAVAYPDVITLASPTKKGNPQGYPTTPSSPSTTPRAHPVLTKQGG